MDEYLTNTKKDKKKRCIPYLIESRDSIVASSGSNVHHYYIPLHTKRKILDIFNMLGHNDLPHNLCPYQLSKRSAKDSICLSEVALTYLCSF